MKIVNREIFLGLPKGTVYSKYEPCCFGELCIKDDSIYNDWYYQDIIGVIDSNDSGEFAEKLFESQREGKSILMDFNCISRDAMYDEELFAVWDKEDVAGLIERLQKSIMDVDKGK